MTFPKEIFYNVKLGPTPEEKIENPDQLVCPDEITIVLCYPLPRPTEGTLRFKGHGSKIALLTKIRSILVEVVKKNRIDPRDFHQKILKSIYVDCQGAYNLNLIDEEDEIPIQNMKIEDDIDNIDDLFEKKEKKSSRKLRREKEKEIKL